jgi:hypothetical protein
MAATPLWQLKQLAERFKWLKVTALQAMVPWHTPQSCEVLTCLSGLPAAMTLLWQVEQGAETPW